MEKPGSSVIVGPGRVGTALAAALAHAGWNISALAGRSLERAERAVAQIGARIQALDLNRLAEPSDLVLLTVSDDVIASVCDRLVEQGVIITDTVVLHTSGAHSSRILASAAKRGSAVASAHPLQTFVSPEAALKALPGSHWYYEGDARAIDVIGQMICDLGGTGHVIETRQKPLYHAGAVIACNYTNVLMDAALQCAEATGLTREDILPGLIPLVKATLDNTAQSSPGEALTGPVSRGDIDTISSHLAALSDLGELRHLYAIMGQYAIRLAKDAGKIDAAQAAGIRDLFRSHR